MLTVIAVVLMGIGGLLALLSLLAFRGLIYKPQRDGQMPENPPDGKASLNYWLGLLVINGVPIGGTLGSVGLFILLLKG